MFVYRAQGILATAVGVLAMGACSDVVSRTDLRTGGPVQVLSVLAMNDAAGGLIESATYCRLNDEKRPGLVGLPDFTTQQVCADDIAMPATEVTDAVPTGWYARIMFDELLDPNVETLTPVLDPDTMQPNGTYTGSLQTTQPVTLKCAGVAVPYDGYYSPSGNNVTWPLGPSLLIKPNDPTVVATGSECEVTVKPVVTSKQGKPVPTDQVGPYKFKIAALALTGTAPAIAADPTMPDTIAPDSAIVLTFNAAIDATTLTAGEVKLYTAADCKAGTARVARGAAIAADGMDPTSIDITDAAPPAAPAGLTFEPSKTYILEFNSAKVADVAGGTLDLPAPADFSLCFNTDAAM
jgi:hypothetical protein